MTDLPPDVAAERLHQELIAAYRLQFTVPADLRDLHLMFEMPSVRRRSSGSEHFSPRAARSDALSLS